MIRDASFLTVNVIFIVYLLGDFVMSRMEVKKKSMYVCMYVFNDVLIINFLISQMNYLLEY